MCIFEQTSNNEAEEEKAMANNPSCNADDLRKILKERDPLHIGAPSEECLDLILVCDTVL